MTDLEFRPSPRASPRSPPSALGRRAPPPAPAQTGDYIVAVVNQELVTAAEVQQRLARVRAEAQQTRAQLPPPRRCASRWSTC